jgi:hypothetical protein
MWLWSLHTLSFFVWKSADKWREPHTSLQLLALFDTKNESASQDQTHMTTVQLYRIVHFPMWVWSSDALSFFLSKRANNRGEPPGSLQLLALFDTKNDSASEDQTHIGKWTILYNCTVVMWVWSWDALSFFAPKRANNWRERFDSLQLFAVFDTKNESAHEYQTHTTTE